LGELGREIDCLVSSDHVKRLHADNELFIEFNYFTFEIVGSFGKGLFYFNLKIIFLFFSFFN